MMKKMYSTFNRQFIHMITKSNYSLSTICNIHYNCSSEKSKSIIMEEVETSIFQVLKSAAKCNQDKLTRKATFEQLGFDSLDSVELIVAMQQYLRLDITNEEAQKITTVEDAINTFYQHKLTDQCQIKDQTNDKTK